jgi:hypothetical protein
MLEAKLFVIHKIYTSVYVFGRISHAESSVYGRESFNFGDVHLMFALITTVHLTGTVDRVH